MTRVTFESGAVQGYLSTLQGVIGRMASNSASCKTWCVSLVSALLVVVVDRHRPDLLPLAGVPILMFVVLDAYYLALERVFRGTYKTVVEKVADGTATEADLFAIEPGADAGKKASEIFPAMGSFAIWPFYGFLVALTLLARVVLL